MCPPSTVPPLLLMGKWYRTPTTLACIILQLLMRYGIVELFITTTNACKKFSKKQHKLDKIQEKQEKQLQTHSNDSSSYTDNNNTIDSSNTDNDSNSNLIHRITRSNSRKNSAADNTETV